MNTPTDTAVADAVIRFLHSRGWHQDGDDAGIWISPDGSQRDLGLGDALMLQLVEDGAA